MIYVIFQIFEKNASRKFLYKIYLFPMFRTEDILVGIGFLCLMAY